MIKYSVIVPAFNAENTIGRCLDSILSQNYGHMEIVLINDGSTDSTNLICEEYANKHSFIRYMRQDNKGVSIARNNGILCANGKYILFVDSDDYVYDGIFETLDRLLREKDYDYIVLSEIRKKGNEEKTVKKSEFRTDNKIDTLKKVRSLISNKGINAPWAKLYQRSIILNYHIFFTPHASIAEDKAFNVKYTMHIKNIRISSVPVYVVTLDNENSLSRKKNRELEWQFKLTKADYEHELQTVDLSTKEKIIIKQGLEFCIYRDVYSNTKRMIIAGKNKNERRAFIIEKCKIINERKLLFPYTRFALMIVIPVKLQWWWLIDFVACKLAKT